MNIFSVIFSPNPNNTNGVLSDCCVSNNVYNNVLLSNLSSLPILKIEYIKCEISICYIALFNNVSIVSLLDWMV